MPAPTNSDRLFGEIALKNRLLTRTQLDECLKALEKGGGGKRSLAEVVEKKGYLSSRAVASIARAQNYREVRLESKLYGRIAVKNKFVDVDDVRQCLEAQKKAYLKGEPPPDFGELLCSRGHVTTEEDRAIREAMRNLDKEALVGKAGRSLEAEDEEGGAEDLGIAEPPEAPAATRKKPSRRIPPKGGKPVRPAAPVRRGAARKPKAAEAKAELIEAGADDDEAVSEAGALGSDLTEVPAEADAEAIDVGNLLDEAADEVDALDSSAPGAPPSDSGSGRAEGEALAPGEELSAAIKEAGVAGGKPALARPMTGDETHDLMDVVMAPSDLAPLRQASESAKPAEGGAPAAAAAPPAPPPERVAEKAGTEGRPAKAISSRRSAPAGVPGPTTESALGPGARVRDVTPPGGVPRLEVEGLAGRRECPRCNVTVEAGTRDCLYCGYVFPETPAPKAASGRKAAVAGAAAAASSGATALGGEFDALRSLASCSRGELLRGKDRKTGKNVLIWKLPAGLAPDEGQVQAFKDDVAAVSKLGLKHVLEMERFVAGPEAIYAVYEDAPGEPATVRVEAGVYDRIRAARVARELAAALAETTGAGIFARELRPEAVLLPADGAPDPRVAAFGIARLCEPPATNVPDASGDAFVPPERLKKTDRADVRTDLFGVGALLKLLLSGKPPSGKEPKDLPDVPGVLKMALAKTLDPATGKRYLEFSRLAEDLERAPGLKGVVVETKR